MVDGTDRDVGHVGQALSEQTQHHAFARAGVAVNHGKAAFADLRVFDTPTKILDLWRHEYRFGGQLWREGIELQPIKGQQFVIHTGPSWAVGRKAGGIPLLE